MKYRYPSFLSRIYLRLLMAVLLSSPFSVTAQQETAFPNEYATWEIDYNWIELGGPAGDQYLSRLDQFESSQYDSDSLMMLSYNGMWFGNSYSTADKVYVTFLFDFIFPYYLHFQADSGVYYLLYDFTLQVGDTAYKDYNGGSNPIYITVNNITMEDHNGDTLKHFYLSNSDIIIEKIGSLQGIFRPFSSSFEIYQRLCSYNGIFVTENIGTTYNYSIDNCLPSTAGLGTHELPSLTAYPNPADNLLHVTSAFPISTCRVYSTIGTLVQIPTKIQDNQLELAVSGLSTGSYLLELTGHNGISQTVYFMKD
jgi:hypothetical protein